MQFQREGKPGEGMEGSSGRLLDLFLNVSLISAEIQTHRTLTLGCAFLPLPLFSSAQRHAVERTTISPMLCWYHRSWFTIISYQRVNSVMHLLLTLGHRTCPDSRSGQHPPPE